MTDAYTQIVASLTMSVSMSVICMDFLHPPESDSHTIMLVIVGAKDGRILTSVYIWDERALLLPGNIQSHMRKLGKGTAPSHLC